MSESHLQLQSTDDTTDMWLSDDVYAFKPAVKSTGLLRYNNLKSVMS